MFKDKEGKQGVEGIQKTQDDVAKMLKIAGCTIGADLQQEKANGSSIIFLGGNKQEDTEEMRKAREFSRKWEERENSKKPYVLTEQEREIVKELLDMDDKFLDIHNIYIYNDGEICVRSPDYTWRTLCGRMWNVNLKEKTARCVALS